MKSGGDAAAEAVAIATIPMTVIAIVTVAAILAQDTIVASDTLKRVRRRTDEAFTPVTLLRSEPARSRLAALTKPPYRAAAVPAISAANGSAGRRRATRTEGSGATATLFSR